MNFYFLADDKKSQHKGNGRSFCSRNVTRDFDNPKWRTDFYYMLFSIISIQFDNEHQRRTTPTSSAGRSSLQTKTLKFIQTKDNQNRTPPPQCHPDPLGSRSRFGRSYFRIRRKHKQKTVTQTICQSNQLL